MASQVVKLSNLSSILLFMVNETCQFKHVTRKSTPREHLKASLQSNTNFSTTKVTWIQTCNITANSASTINYTLSQTRFADFYRKSKLSSYNPDAKHDG